jgi:hypothetical protein
VAGQEGHRRDRHRPLELPPLVIKPPAFFLGSGFLFKWDGIREGLVGKHIRSGWSSSSFFIVICQCDNDPGLLPQTIFLFVAVNSNLPLYLPLGRDDAGGETESRFSNQHTLDMLSLSHDERYSGKRPLLPSFHLLSSAPRRFVYVA